MDGKADKTRKPRGWGCTRKWREKSAPETPCFPRSNGWLAGWLQSCFSPASPPHILISMRWPGNSWRELHGCSFCYSLLLVYHDCWSSSSGIDWNIRVWWQRSSSSSQSAIFAAVCAVLLCIMAGERFYGPFLFPFALATHLMVW